MSVSDSDNTRFYACQPDAVAPSIYPSIHSVSELHQQKSHPVLTEPARKSFQSLPSVMMAHLEVHSPIHVLLAKGFRVTKRTRTRHVALASLVARAPSKKAIHRLHFSNARLSLSPLSTYHTNVRSSRLAFVRSHSISANISETVLALRALEGSSEVRSLMPLGTLDCISR